MPRTAPGLGDAFSYTEGLAAGLTPDELRHPDWARSHRGIRSHREALTPLELAVDYLPRMQPHQYFSHTTAALAWDMWLPLEHEQRLEIHVAVPPGHRQPRGARIRGHLLIDRPGPLLLRQGLRVARPEETWCQLATILGMEDLIVAGESLMAKGRDGRLELRVLRHAAAAGDRPRQMLLNRVLPELRSGVRSPRETVLRRAIVAGGLPEPVINMDVFDDFGTWVSECDLVYPQWRIVIEYEGDLHFLDPRQQRKDVGRYELLQSLGWRVIRVTKDDMGAKLPATVERIRAVVLAAAAARA